MVSFTQTELVGLATVMLTVILGLSSTGEGYLQELWMYTEEGNALYFQTNVPDLTSFSSTLPKITRACMRGLWTAFTSVNYQHYFSLKSWSANGTLTCSPLNVTNLKSLRHWGANETLTDAVSMFSGQEWDGEEILVTSKAKTDISVPIVSFAATGTAAWMLYEGKNLDGKSYCLPAPLPGSTIRSQWVSGSPVNLITIGSIFKGCNAREIQLYRESHFV